MVATVGSIRVAFGADLSAYEASLRKGEKRTNDFERNAGKAVDGVGQQFIRLGGLAKAGLAGLATGLVAGGVTGIIGKFGDVARSVAEIGDEAKRAGLSARSFQELGYVAKANRIEVDALTDGMKELSLRADEYIATGKGSAAESFQRLGISAEDLKKKLADPSALFTEIIGKLGQLDKAAQIRIADELFGGTGGEKFVQLIAQGEEGIRDTIAEAHRLGAVMDDEVIEAAAELDRKFAAVATTVGTALKTAIVDAATELQKFIDQFRTFDERATSTLKDRFGELQTRYGQLVKQQGSWEDSALGLIGKDAATEMQAVKAEMDQVAAELRQRATPMLREKLVAAQSANTPYVPPPSTSGRSGSTKAVRTERDAVAELIERLQEEKDLIGATDLERDTANALRHAGAGATAEQKAQIVSLVAAIHAETEAQRQAADAMDLYRDIAGGVMNDLRSALSDGKLSWEELGDVAMNVLNRIVDKLLNDVLDAIFRVNGAGSGLGGGGGGLFSGIFSILGFDQGGYTGPGPRLKPAGIVHAGEYVFSQPAVKRIGVGNLAALHTAAKLGYAEGGMVGSSAMTVADRTMSDLSSASGAFSDRLVGEVSHVKEEHASVDVRVAMDRNGNLQAYVERTSGKVAAAVVAHSTPSIVRAAENKIQHGARTRPGYFR